jgi:hypothetical protein
MIANSKSTCSSRRLLLDFSLNCLRLAVILGGLAFVAYGWFATVTKYMSGKTSISSVVNETTEFPYPAVTFCTGHSDEIFTLLDSFRQRLAQGDTEFREEEDVASMLSSSEMPLDNFLASQKRINLTGSNSRMLLWSGPCQTYDPKGKRGVGVTYGINFELTSPESLSTHQKMVYLTQVASVFVHDRDKFFYQGPFMEAMPGSVRMDVSQLRNGTWNMVSINYSRFTHLDTKEHPCEADESVSFVECFERELARSRGCHKPWHYLPDLEVPKCGNISQILSLYDEEHDQLFMSTEQRANVSGCPRPCTHSVYSLEYNYHDVHDAKT